MARKVSTREKMPPAMANKSGDGSKGCGSAGSEGSEGSADSADSEGAKGVGPLSVGLFFMFLWIVTTPQILHKAGVIDKPPTNLTDMKEDFENFFSTHVQSVMDSYSNYSNSNGTLSSNDALRPGHQLSARGAVAKHPIVIVPGFVTSGLELWEGEECFKTHFRQRLWGSVSMARSFFYDRECWRRHLSLDPITGMDPNNIRLRAAQGFEAADNFIATYWVWAKLIENLADVGYDGSNMVMMSYDWRLAFHLIETRDGFFTKMKHTIEALVQTTNQKVIITSHSMGGTVVFYFMQWVTIHTNGGKHWLDNHLHSFVNIAGTLLGVPKAIPSLLSGELKDTAALFTHFDSLLEQYFGRQRRKNLWNTWGSLFGLLPKGGDAIWAVGADLEGDDVTSDASKQMLLAPIITWNDTYNTEGTCPAKPSQNQLTTSTTTDIMVSEYQHEHEHEHEHERSPYESFTIPPSKKWSLKQTTDFLLRTGGGFGSKLSASGLFSFDTKKGWKTKSKQEHWHNPAARPLPKAPSLKIYCMYGVGIQTERAYFYRPSCDNRSSGDNEKSNCNSNLCAGEEPPNSPFLMDNSIEDDAKNVHYGVRFSDGDGTVPLVSLGYMCQKWNEKRSSHNPSGIKVVTRERKDAGINIDLSDPGRGGPNAGDHVDILGNLGVLEDVVKIATGFELATVDEELIVSDIKRIVKEIDSHPLGGLKNAIRN